MSAAAQTRVFGMRIGVDPKILIGALLVVAVIVYWYNSRGDEETTGPVTTTRGAVTPVATAVRTRTPVRRQTQTNDRGTLRLRPVDPTRGNVHATLRLDLLARLQSVQAVTGGRNLFEMGPPPLTPEQKAAIANAPKIVPKPPMPPPPNVGQITPEASKLDIPLKYYGFAKPSDKGESNRGFFLDHDDNVLVASEGETVKVANQHYLVVELTANSARLEDVDQKLGQTLPVVPVGQVGQ